MAGLLNGRFGPYKPRTPAERAKARKQAQEARLAAIRRQDWLSRHSTCLNGCGQPVAFYDEVHLSLRYGGCCSAACEESYRAKEL